MPNPNIVCVTSKHSLGCTFVDWSINFLSGNSNFFKITEMQQVPLSLNPINSHNSHGHKKNHPSGLNKTIDYIRKFQEQKSGFYTMYPCPLNIDDICNILNIDHSMISNPEIFQQIYCYQDQDYNDMIDFCINESVQVIYVHNNTQSVGYFWNLRTLDRQLLTSEPYRNIDHAREDFLEIFFNSSLKSWSTVETSNRWDIREKIALDIRPYDLGRFSDIGITKPHCWVDCQDLWHSTDEVLIDVMKFINVPIDTQRWKLWLPIMSMWQAIQKKQLKFYYVVDHIVKSIVNNWYYPLGSLSLFQEAVIQHCLIYKHNLNLKTWQLDSFPSNTQDLHKLIEPNFHTVPTLY
jgi:hypothetical protein